MAALRRSLAARGQYFTTCQSTGIGTASTPTTSGISLNRTQKVEELLSVLSTPPRQVDDAEMALLHKRFSWQSIVPALFERIRQLVISTTPLPCLREYRSGPCTFADCG